MVVCDHNKNIQLCGSFFRVRLRTFTMTLRCIYIYIYIWCWEDLLFICSHVCWLSVIREVYWDDYEFRNGLIFLLTPLTCFLFSVGSCKRIKDGRKKTWIPFNSNFILGFNDYSVVIYIYIYIKTKRKGDFDLYEQTKKHR